jgi:hypothetical protein
MKPKNLLSAKNVFNKTSTSGLSDNPYNPSTIYKTGKTKDAVDISYSNIAPSVN